MKKVMEQELKNLLLICHRLFEPPEVPVCKAGYSKRVPNYFFHTEELKFKRGETYFWHLSV